ncbi:TIGR03085 family metal-binding protein [Jongsikchunia kroppenstedtii]|uniref:TIGR03085 family metal-binding protein n=1 Tax=Jongsikchunia kroppenstedtii TaxID=1121721 RepID=UPI0003628514|nr:TIGR03085 family metal-binding protein [Jongsikchunia kroppenstedtii]
MTAAQDERAALVATLREVGPDAPTLCGGWTTRDLVAHLILREGRPDAAGGILIKALSGYHDKVFAKIAAGDWDQMLDKLASGPPVYSPFKLVDNFANLSEMFVHHEDVRRTGADWTPREIGADLQRQLRRPVATVGKQSLRRSPATTVLKTPDGAELARGGSGSVVEVTGEPAELLLFAFGREPAQVEFAGDADAVAAVKAAKRGF